MLSDFVASVRALGRADTTMADLERRVTKHLLPFFRPSGPPQRHSSLATLDLVLTRDGDVPLRLHTPHAGCYELGMRETTHGLPVQPFADP